MQKIQTLVDEIASGYKPEKIYLFGSYANGTPGIESDIDLFIVKNTDVRKIHRSIMVRDIISDYFSADGYNCLYPKRTGNSYDFSS